MDSEKEQQVSSPEKEPEFKAYCHTPEEVCEHFQTDPNDGLSSEEVQKRFAKYGPNKLEEGKKVPFIIKLLKQFIEPMVIVLLIAALISLAIFIFHTASGDESEEWIDCIVILAIVIINALIGAIQEQKAEQSLEALKKLSSPTCTVKRDGKLCNIKAEELVPGDLVILEEGVIIPADVRLITSVDMKSDESSLTGESVPAEKDARAVLGEDTLVADQATIGHMSCPISYGRGTGIVIGTGMNTEMGKIANMLTNSEDEETPLQKKLAVLSKQLGLICLIIVVVTFLVGVIAALIQAGTAGNWSEIGENILELFENAIALAVAAIPEGLPAIVTIALALGVGKMVKVNTIVRKLPSVETLGSVTVVCSDKTGTLTQNRMTVKKVYQDGVIYDADKAVSPNFLATGMMLCSNASINGDRYGDPTELALLDYAYALGIEKEKTEATSQPRVDELPFDSVRKMMSTENMLNGRKIIYTKGALDSILKHTEYIDINGQVRPITPEDIETINRASSEMASQAFRVLAFAYRFNDGGERLSETHLIYKGMVGMIDPERPEAKPAVSTFKKAGIRTVMITGDHKDTAFAIAKNLGIADDINQCMSGDEINALDEQGLQEKVNTTNVFARVSPENKVQIVKALKANGNIVSMTGDGVNDAPSLKAADIGIAMGITGTDVAKSAADMVLTDDNFASIEKAVEEGRGIFSNVKKAIFYLLSSNFAEVLVMFFFTILTAFSKYGVILPLATLHILWINLITDSLPAIALGMDDKEKGIMDQKPRDPKDGVFAHGGLKFTLFYGAIIFLITAIAFFLPVFEHMGDVQAGMTFILDGKEIQLDSGWEWSLNGFFNCMNSSATYLNEAGEEVVVHIGVQMSGNQWVPYNIAYATEEALDEIQFSAGVLNVHEQAQTFAFTVLAMAQVFHMVGMTDIKHSFINVFKGKNWMLLVSFVFGFAMQVLVTEVNGMNMVFGTTHLQWFEWFELLGFAIVPLVVHEICAPIFRAKNVQII
ncbi:MAG TPA: calcium-translocating P-type ATPase, PMCA-type [Candidatus Enterosoma merdigallinarum]|nr:calcium-translocating P-type ATPase, PMCA-type [Candidatus Enterosoma merdigallinarum]